MTVLTPAARTVARRVVFWVAAATFAVIVALLMMTMAGSGAEGERLSPSSAAPAGARAVAEVLREQGVDVIEVDSFDAAQDAVEAAASATLLVHDVQALLPSERLGALTGLSDRIVLLDPTFDALQELAPALALAGSVDGRLDAECSLRAAENAGSITGDGQGYRVTDANAEATSCFGSGDDVYSLVEVRAEGRTVTVLGATEALTNDLIAADGNAALAFTLLGERSTLVWYVPGPADLPASDAPITAYLPRWVSVISIALLAVGLAAAFWRGRRLGPLVVEQLPVTVPAGEVTEGRARLYERNTTRLHTLDALRIGTVDRIARRCGLPRTATVDEVAASVASITGRPAPQVRGLLIDQVPSSDSELVRLSDALLELEDAVDHALGGPAQHIPRTDARNIASGPGPDGPSNLDDLREAPDERNATDHGRTH